MIEFATLRDVLLRGSLDIEGHLSGASNATLRAVSALDGVEVTCVYKPRRGERPLWDFPTGSLGLREVAAFEVSRSAGWPLIPVTVWRDEGPYGAGMCQQWIEVDETAFPVEVLAPQEVPTGWRTIAEGEGMRGEPVCLAHEDSADLRRLSLLDVVLNNADRKGGHVLRDGDGRLQGIDHGLTFHVDDKLRTVLWGWAGEEIEPADRDALTAWAQRWAGEGVLDDLGELLTVTEARMTQRRLEDLLAGGHYPDPGGAWPALPWPAM